jgi:CRISPR-associated protein Cmr3
VVLRAAVVPRPLHVSGWDMAARAPKPTSRMVPPGAVYFFERVDGQPFGEAEARALWLAAIGARTDEGFGRVVPGTWNPKRG